MLTSSNAHWSRSDYWMGCRNHNKRQIIDCTWNIINANNGMYGIKVSLVIYKLIVKTQQLHAVCSVGRILRSVSKRYFRYFHLANMAFDDNKLFSGWPYWYLYKICKKNIQSFTVCGVGRRCYSWRGGIHYRRLWRRGKGLDEEGYNSELYSHEDKHISAGMGSSWEPTSSYSALYVQRDL